MKLKTEALTVSLNLYSEDTQYIHQRVARTTLESLYDRYLLSIMVNNVHPSGEKTPFPKPRNESK